MNETIKTVLHVVNILLANEAVANLIGAGLLSLGYGIYAFIKKHATDNKVFAALAKGLSPEKITNDLKVTVAYVEKLLVKAEKKQAKKDEKAAKK